MEGVAAASGFLCCRGVRREFWRERERASAEGGGGDFSLGETGQ